MKQNYFEIAAFCRELSILIHAGVRVGDGLALLAEEEPDTGRRQWLTEMAQGVDDGAALAAAMKTSGAFPGYAIGLIEVGEHSGRMEETLDSLAVYYEERGRIENQIRNALIYPSVLLLLMLAVIAVLLVRVLPVFNEVYASLGAELTGIAGLLLQLGRLIDALLPALCALLAAVCIFLALFSCSDRFHRTVQDFWRTRWGDRGVSRKLNDAHFAQAIATGLGSGLPAEEALELAAGLAKDIPGASARCEDCRNRLMQDGDLAKAMRESGLMSSAACRLLALGISGGSADTVMAEIAGRLAREADDALAKKVALVEPTLVLLTSFLVGAILLSVMLPLMNIMSAIG